MNAGLTWKMDELVRLSQRLIELLPEGESKRVRWFPNERLVRYYTTLGLLDRPAAIKGRTAYYRLRHLLQVLAIKTLQTQGLSLQEVQLKLAGCSDSQLVETIGLPDDYQARLRLEAPGKASPPPRKRFWERVPEGVAATPAAAPPSREALPLQGLELGPGIHLVIDSRLYPDLDPQQLRQAAQTLVNLLNETTEDNR